MDYAAITSAIASGRAIFQLTKAFTDLKVDTKILTRMNEIEHKVSDLLDDLFQTREDLFKLQKEKEDALDQLKNMQDWEATKAKYRMVSTVGGATVYESVESSPKHYACPVCFTRKNISPLQTTDGGYYNCPSCKGTEYKVREPAPRPHPKVETDFDPRVWRLLSPSLGGDTVPERAREKKRLLFGWF
jgi:hypothetical protein